MGVRSHQKGQHRLEPRATPGLWASRERLLAPAVIIGVFGGAAGAVLGITAAMLSAQQLRKHEGGWVKFVAAAGIEIVAVVLWLGIGLLLGRL